MFKTYKHQKSRILQYFTLKSHDQLMLLIVLNWLQIRMWSSQDPKSSFQEHQTWICSLNFCQDVLHDSLAYGQGRFPRPPLSVGRWGKTKLPPKLAISRSSFFTVFYNTFCKGFRLIRRPGSALSVGQSALSVGQPIFAQPRRLANFCPTPGL